MKGTPLLFIKERTIPTNILTWTAFLAVDYSYTQASNKFGSLRKVSSTQGNITHLSPKLSLVYEDLHQDSYIATLLRICPVHCSTFIVVQ